MVQWLTREHTYTHPWERVTLAFWRKYPNPLSPHVKEIDILNRFIDSQGRLVTIRLLTCKGSVPDWLSKIIGSDNKLFCLEKSVVDRENKTLVMVSRNLSYETLLSCDEICRYQADGTNTVFTQEAKITVPIWGLSSKAENHAVTNFKANAHKGTAVMENICDHISKEQEEQILSNLQIQKAE